MRYLLNPIPIAKYLTLDECLSWVAYKHFSACIHHTPNEAKFTNICDGMFYCERNLRPLNRRDDIAFEVVRNNPDIPPSLPDPEDDDGFEKLKKSVQKQIKHDHDKMNLPHDIAVGAALDHFENRWKIDLFTNIQNGNLPTYGQLAGVLKSEQSS